MRRALATATIGLATCAGTAMADGTLELGTQQLLSTNGGGAADKSKLVALEYPQPGGFAKVLVCVFADAVGPEVWDYAGRTAPSKDIFATRSTDGGATWSEPVNISNTALLSSFDADHDGLPETPPIPYHGDSEKPTIFNNGKNVIVTWVGRYVPTGEQRSVVYLESGGIEVPYAAVYAVRSTDGGATWSVPQVVTDGSRDAKQDVGRGTSVGWMITWQEDPQGLQPGEAEGPGEGGSGAKVSKGTDIWWTSLPNSAFVAGTTFPEGVRLTDNFTMIGSGGPTEGYETGIAGASRANLALVGGTAIVAYEETKGTQGLDEGKYVRYHVFSAFDDSMPDATAGAGWIISDPTENARRVRFVTQGTPGPSSGIKMFIFFKQGLYDQGGPSDIIARSGINGFLPENLVPAVAPNPTTREVAMDNSPGMNLSSAMGLDAATDDNPYEDSRAHRAIIDGDFVALGYSYTPDWAVARFTDLENYNFWLTRSFDGGTSWDEPTNLSNITDTTINVKEPRLIKTPSSPDPSTPRNPDTFIVAWGTEVNQYEHLADEPLPLDIFLTRTVDRGETYEPLLTLAGGVPGQTYDEFESQIRVNAPGTEISAVWQETDTAGVTTVQFNTAIEKSPALPGDLNGDGLVDGADLALLLGAWGPCPAKDECSADIDGDGMVGGADLAVLLGGWTL
jgi:hypothetical protein